MKYPRRYAPIHPEQPGAINRNNRAESVGLPGRFPSEQVGGFTGIRSLSQLEKYETISSIILVDLRNHGRLLNSSRGVFFLDRVTFRVLDIADKRFASLCHDRYGTVASTEEWKYFVQYLTHVVLEKEPEVTVRDFAYYDGERHALYVVGDQKSMWKLDGSKIESVPLGFDDVFLAREAFDAPISSDGVGHTLDTGVLKYLSLDYTSGMLDAQARLLIKVWVWAVFFHEALPTRPMLCLIGPPGSGKTTVLKLVGTLLMGPKFKVQHMPDRRGDLETLLINTRLVAIDNTDAYISNWVLDLLAIVATGGEVARRELYTTNDIRRYPLSCFLALTSHKPHFKRPDIAERLIVIPTQRVVKFQEERKMIDTLLRDRGYVWAQLLEDLNRIVNSLKMRPRIDEVTDYRLSDFANFGLLAVPAEERSAWKSTLKAYALSQAYFLLNEDHVAVTLRNWLARKQGRRVENLTSRQIAREAWSDLDKAEFSEVRLGKRLSKESDPLRAWFQITRRIRGGVSYYDLQLRDGVFAP